MSDDLATHLKAIQAWLDHVDQVPLPVPPAQGLSAEGKQQLQAVNKAVEQLTRLGVEIPGDLRSLKLRLSAADTPAVLNPHIPKHLATTESLIDSLRELSHTARMLRDKLRSGITTPGTKKHFGVTLEELLDAGLLSVDDRLELQWSRESGVYEGKLHRNGTISAKTLQGWKQFDSLSTAASSISGRPQNGWDHWRRINADGSRTPLKEIREKHLNPTTDS